MKPFRLSKYGLYSRYFSVYRPSTNRIRVLGIETSCDDTCAAIVDTDKRVLGEVKYSQSRIHAIHGGIMVNITQNLHEKYLKPAVEEVLAKSNLNVNDLDVIAVTVKPGMYPNLMKGIGYAKDLCTLYNKPLMPIHHMEAHALTVRLMENVEFPFLVLLISGGHCILSLAEDVHKFSILGETIDQAPGATFDRISRRLKLKNLKEYTFLQGGVAIEKSASKGNPLAVNFPISLSQRYEDCAFSMAGMATAAERYIYSEEKRLNIIGDQLLPNVHDVSASFLFAIARHICRRVELGMRYLNIKNIMDGCSKTLVVSGGVASNEFIRQMLGHICDKYDYRLVVPPKSLCTDNGVMIAWNAIERLKKGLPTVEPGNFETVHAEQRCDIGEKVLFDVCPSDVAKGFVSLRKILKSGQVALKQTNEETRSLDTHHEHSSFGRIANVSTYQALASTVDSG